MNLNFYQFEDETIKLTPITVDQNLSDSINLLLLGSNLYIVYKKGSKIYFDDENKFKHLSIPFQVMPDHSEIQDELNENSENKEKEIKSQISEHSRANNDKENIIYERIKESKVENKGSEISKLI